MFSVISATNLSVVLLSTVFLVVFISWFKKKSRFNELISKLPKGPKAYPIVGCALEFLGGYDKILETWEVTWPEKYGECFVSYVGPHVNVNISSPELLEKVMNSQKILDKGADYDFLLPWLGDGLLLSGGAKWKSRRRLLTPAFHYQILDNFISVFNKQTRILCGLLEGHCGSEPFNVFPFITNCTLDIICEAAMGINIRAQTEESDYVKAVLRINQLMMERITKPWYGNDILFRLFPIGREHDKLLGTLHTFTENVINNRKEELKLNPITEEDMGHQSGLKNRRPLLDTLLTSNMNLTDLDIREEIDTFMFEGHDTTASAISWFIYCMASNPELQEKAWIELKEVFGDDSDRDCTQQDLSQLPYLECCIKESGRLYTTVPNVERFATEDIQIGEYLIPTGTSVLMLLYRLHRNPRIFPDPLTYNPDRFSPENSVGRHPYAYMPFSAGPRNCIGQRFAHMEVKVTACNLLRRFKFSVSALSQKPIPSFQVVLKPLNGMDLVLSPR